MHAWAVGCTCLLVSQSLQLGSLTVCHRWSWGGINQYGNWMNMAGHGRARLVDFWELITLVLSQAPTWWVPRYHKHKRQWIICLGVFTNRKTTDFQQICGVNHNLLTLGSKCSKGGDCHVLSFPTSCTWAVWACNLQCPAEIPPQKKVWKVINIFFGDSSFEISSEISTSMYRYLCKIYVNLKSQFSSRFHVQSIVNSPAKTTKLRNAPWVWLSWISVAHASPGNKVQLPCKKNLDINKTWEQMIIINQWYLFLHMCVLVDHRIKVRNTKKWCDLYINAAAVWSTKWFTDVELIFIHVIQLYTTQNLNH